MFEGESVPAIRNNASHASPMANGSWRGVIRIKDSIWKQGEFHLLKYLLSTLRMASAARDSGIGPKTCCIMARCSALSCV